MADAFDVFKEDLRNLFCQSMPELKDVLAFAGDGLGVDTEMLEHCLSPTNNSGSRSARSVTSSYRLFGFARLSSSSPVHSSSSFRLPEQKTLAWEENPYDPNQQQFSLSRQVSQQAQQQQVVVPDQPDHKFDIQTDAAQCSICCDNAAICCPTPCHHLYSCVGCAREAVRLSGGAGNLRCAVCRDPVVRFERIYVTASRPHFASSHATGIKPT